MELLVWLRNRPDEAKMLAEVLGVKSSEESNGRWVTCSKAAEMIGRSASWVRRHIEMFPMVIKTKSCRGKECYMIREKDVMGSFERHIR